MKAIIGVGVLIGIIGLAGCAPGSNAASELDPCEAAVERASVMRESVDRLLSGVPTSEFYWQPEPVYDTSSAKYAEAVDAIHGLARFIVDSPECFSNSDVYEAKEILGYED